VDLAAAVLLSLGLICVINVHSFGWTIRFELPGLFLAQLSAAVLAAICLAGLYPARVAARLQVQEQVVED